MTESRNRVRAGETRGGRWLRRERARFAPAFFERHRARLETGERGQVRFSALLLLIFALSVLYLVRADGSAIPAAVSGGLCVFVFGTGVAARLLPEKGQVLPFFDRPVGADTFLAGTALLWNSRALDAIAAERGVTPLSAFDSGDPVLYGEEQCLFDPADALRTTETLLGDPETGLLGEAVRDDLTKLHLALERAVEKQAKFCLHLRTISVTSGHEMGLRNGSYF